MMLLQWLSVISDKLFTGHLLTRVLKLLTAVLPLPEEGAVAGWIVSIPVDLYWHRVKSPISSPLIAVAHNRSYLLPCVDAIFPHQSWCYLLFGPFFFSLFSLVANCFANLATTNTKADEHTHFLSKFY